MFQELSCMMLLLLHGRVALTGGKETLLEARCIQPHKSLHGFRAAHSSSTLASALHVERYMQICSPQTLMERGEKKRAATSGFGDQQANENKDLSHVK